ncbi:MAG: hypothetical protein ACPIOQ_37490, partial [Promethearchaeia archaeon]
MLNWYKLANEAAMKAALVKQKRFKEVPRYNPAAERVRQQGACACAGPDVCHLRGWRRQGPGEAAHRRRWLRGGATQ